MTVIGSSAAERVGLLGKELQHELFGRHPERQKNGVVPVIGVEVILWPKATARRDLDGFVPVGTGVYILGRQLGVDLVKVGHGPGGAHLSPIVQRGSV